MEKTSGLCPSSGSLSVDYELQQPNGGALAVAQDVVGMLASPFLPFIGLNERVEITISNPGTVVWTVTALSLTNAADFDLLDPLIPYVECKGQTLERNEGCVVGVKCKTLNTSTNLKVETTVGIIYDWIRCQ
jgi:hypothetical protein